MAAAGFLQSSGWGDHMLTLCRFGRCWGFAAARQGSLRKMEKTSITHCKAGGGVLIEILCVGGSKAPASALGASIAQLL